MKLIVDASQLPCEIFSSSRSARVRGFNYMKKMPIFTRTPPNRPLIWPKGFQRACLHALTLVGDHNTPGAFLQAKCIERECANDFFLTPYPLGRRDPKVSVARYMSKQPITGKSWERMRRACCSLIFYFRSARCKVTQTRRKTTQVSFSYKSLLTVQAILDRVISNAVKSARSRRRNV